MEKRILTEGMEYRFKRECYIVRACNNPYLVTIFEYFEDKERLYACFEYLKGGDLLSEINKRKSENRRFTER
jgi:serine/threonine protein kinase